MHTVDVGQIVAFDYPAANYSGVRTRWENRRMRIERIRDVRTSPLEQATIELDPLLRRGRWLVTGLHLDKGEERSFYLESMREVKAIDVEPSSVVMEDAYGTSYAVAVIECDDDDYMPGDGELPDEFRIVDVMVNGVAIFFAQAIADAANRDAFAAGLRGKWAVPLPPGYVNRWQP